MTSTSLAILTTSKRGDGGEPLLASDPAGLELGIVRQQFCVYLASLAAYAEVEMLFVESKGVQDLAHNARRPMDSEGRSREQLCSVKDAVTSWGVMFYLGKGHPGDGHPGGLELVLTR